LFDTILEKDHFSEREAAETIRPIIDAIGYCHSLNIIHRDIKVFTDKIYTNYCVARESIILIEKSKFKSNKSL
jgi:serine/threonine protein kinase